MEIARVEAALSTVAALAPSIAAAVQEGMGNARVVAVQEGMEKADAAVASIGAAAKIVHLVVLVLAADLAVNQNLVVLAAHTQIRMKCPSVNWYKSALTAFPFVSYNQASLISSLYVIHSLENFNK